MPGSLNRRHKHAQPLHRLGSEGADTMDLRFLVFPWNWVCKLVCPDNLLLVGGQKAGLTSFVMRICIPL